MGIKNYLSLLTAVLETVVAGGILYGWSSFNYVLVNEGFFSSGCNTTTQTLKNSSTKSLCAYQQFHLQLIFAIGATVSVSLMGVIGVVMDRLGTWTLRSIASISFTLGCLSIALSTPETSWILYPSSTIISTAGFALFLADSQAANLFPKFRGLILNFMNAAAEVSIGALTVVKVLYERYDVSMEASFMFLAALGIAFFIRTFFLSARERFPYEISPGYYYGIKECCSNQTLNDESNEKITLLEKAKDCEKDEEAGNIADLNETNDEQSLKSCMFSSIYVLATFSFVIQELRLNFFVEELNSWMFFMLRGKSAAYSSYLNAFGFLQFSALLLAPIGGLLFDLSFKHFSKQKSMTEFQAKLKSTSLNCFLGSSMTITYSILALIPVPKLQYFTFIIFDWSDFIFWANLQILLLTFFPMKYFGTLFGVAVFLSAVVSLIEYLFLYAAIHYFGGSFLVVNVIVLILALMSLAHPINLYRLHKKQSS